MPTQEEINKFNKVETIIFDMDGVITSEAEYWNSADLTVLEILYSDQFFDLRDTTFNTILRKPGVSILLDRFVSQSFIALLKNNGINSNWDLAFFSASLYIIDIMKNIDDKEALEAAISNGLDAEAIQKISTLITDKEKVACHIDEMAEPFITYVEKRRRETGGKPDDPAKSASEFSAHLRTWLKKNTGIDSDIFRRVNKFWDLCRDLFQEWYLGDSLIQDQGTKKIGNVAKNGMIWLENPLLKLQKIINTLALLKEAGITIGVATGRPYNEIIIPLHKWGLLHFFESARLCTHRDVKDAERHIAEYSEPRKLDKPHPYVYLRAIFPDSSIDDLLEMELPLDKELGSKVMIVGDSMSDLMAARTIGCLSAAVLTGVMDLETASIMKKYNPDFILENMTELEKLF